VRKDPVGLWVASLSPQEAIDLWYLLQQPRMVRMFLDYYLRDVLPAVEFVDGFKAFADWLRASCAELDEEIRRYRAGR
jgi:hypothetical protein